MHSWSYALCVTQFFKTLVGWRYQSILVCYILSFFIVCTVWLILLTLWMLAVQNCLSARQVVTGNRHTQNKDNPVICKNNGGPVTTEGHRKNNHSSPIYGSSERSTKNTGTQDPIHAPPNANKRHTHPATEKL